MDEFNYIFMWVEENYPGRNPYVLKSITEEYYEEWDNSRDNYSQVEEYLEEVLENGDLL